MSAPSQQSDFWVIWGDSLPSLSEARPARTSAAPTPKAKASKASGLASTSRRSASSEKSDLVGLLLRTALISELGALTPSSLRWRRSATPAGRSWFVLETSGPTTNGPGAGSSPAMSSKLPTPIASFQMSGQSNPGLKAKGVVYPAMVPLIEISAGRMEPGRFRGDMEGWAKTSPPLSTPRASDMRAGGHGDTGRMGTMRHQLQEAMLATPRKTDADRGFRGDVPSQLNGYHSKHVGMLPTPTAVRYGSQSYPEDPSRKRLSLETLIKGKMPTPLASDHKGSLGIMSNGKVKSPNVPTYLRDGKWAYARQIAALLTEAGLTGPSLTLPITYGWMMGYPPGWLAHAFQSAMAKGSLLPASRSKRSATPSSRKSPKE